MVTTWDPVTKVQGPTFAWASTSPDAASTVGAPLSIAWGCMPPGTEIKMADGSKVAIEKVAPGQKVVADDKGHTLTVMDVMVGSERKPLVHVVDSHGNLLSLTDTHPVPTADAQLVQARDLALGDSIITDSGVTKVVSIEKEPYEGMVYNLVLGTPEERQSTSGNETTMYANGVLVGDAQMQSVVKQRNDATAMATRLASLPESLRKDFELTSTRAALRAQAKR
jgi:hypothetical protein